MLLHTVCESDSFSKRPQTGNVAMLAVCMKLETIRRHLASNAILIFNCDMQMRPILISIFMKGAFLAEFFFLFVF